MYNIQCNCTYSNFNKQNKCNVNKTLPKSMSFESLNQTQTEPQKKELSNGAKISIGLGITTLIALSIELAACKGKHIKSLWGKFGSKNTKGLPDNNSVIADFKNINEAKKYFEKKGINTVFKNGSENHLADLNSIKNDLYLLEKNGVAIQKPDSIIISDWHNIDESKQIFRNLNIQEEKANTTQALSNYWGTIEKSSDNKCHVLINSSFNGNYNKFIHEMGHIHQDYFRTSFWHSKGLSDIDFIKKQIEVFGLSNIGIHKDGIEMILQNSGSQFTPAIFRDVNYYHSGNSIKQRLKNLFPNIVSSDDYLKLFPILSNDGKTYVINAKKMTDKMYAESHVYAPAKIWENVAEIFEGLNKGKEYSDLVMLMYDINGGGRVPNLVIKGMKYDDYIQSLYNNKNLIQQLRECIEIKQFV